MHYPSTPWLPPTPPHTPPDDYVDPLGLVQTFADISLDFGSTSPTAWVPALSLLPPPSYDPMSPSYDPSAASPCNPFPTSSPFVFSTFTRPKAGSRLKFEYSYNCEDAEPYPSLLVQPISQSPSRSLSQAAALSRIPPPHSAPSRRRTKPCRFYLDPSGCKSGRWCNFKHPVGARSEDRLCNEDSTLDELRAAVIRSRIANDAANSDISAWDDVPDVRDLNPDWGKKGEDDLHPKWRTQPCRNFLLGLCRYGDKCQFIHPPGLFPAAAPESYPTSLSFLVPLDVASNSAPVPLSVWGAHPGIGVLAGTSSSEGVISTKPEQMSLFYRTKPCKYFDVDGTCPHGSACKFIHDPKKSPASSTTCGPTSATQRPSWADDDREIDFEDMPSFWEMEESASTSEEDGAMQDMTNEGAARSASMRRRDRARTRNAARDANQKVAQQSGGIFRPMWRVVGGGVMLANIEGNMKDALSNRVHEDDDAVLDYQPRDLATSVAPTFPVLAQSDTPSNNETLAVYAGDFDCSVFSIDPAEYPPTDLFSPDAQLEITMGDMEGLCLALANPPPRTKRVVTGADLMRGIMDTGLEALGTRRTPSPPRDKDRHKPRLTIAVPSFSHTSRRTQSYGAKGYSPYPHVQPRRVEESKLSVRTDAGDDVLDWGDDDDGLECGVDAEGAALSSCGNEAFGTNGEDIRRVRSTPPTPRSSTSIFDVSILPRLAAESP